MNYKDELIKKIECKSAFIGVIGLGYVGLPLALAFAEKEFNVIGFDVDEEKIPLLNSGKSYIKHISSSKIETLVSSGKFNSTSDFTKLKKCDAILICVPTPLNANREPDVSFIKNTAKMIAENGRAGQLIVLESSTYPGTTEEILLPILNEKFSSFFKNKESVGNLFFLAFSPEREDPGNIDYSTNQIPKIIGGITKSCLEIASKLYMQVIVEVVKVSSTKTAEAAKLLENIYRSVNIALVNELKIVFDRMGIDVWEVIEAAKTKPFGFSAFYPGPGLGGHCIPIDPFYLTWKAREFDVSTKFIELAGEVNTLQPYYVFENVVKRLNEKGKTINGSRILILGISYKKNIDDIRESPALKLIEILRNNKAVVDYSDPYVGKLKPTRKYNFEMETVAINSSTLANYDLALLVTDHDHFDYHLISQHCNLIIDSRNAFGSRGIKAENIYKT